LKRILLLLTVLLFAPVDGGAADGGIVIDGSTTVGPIAKSFAAYFTGRYGVPVTVSERVSVEMVPKALSTEPATLQQCRGR